MKYRIGEKVIVSGFKNLNDVTGHEDVLLGAVGVISSYYDSHDYPYEIEFDDKLLNELGLVLWAEEELNYFDFTQSIKNSIEHYIKTEVDRGVRKANIEIELIHFIKNKLYSE